MKYAKGQRLWPRFGIAVAATFVGAVIFAVILAILAFFVLGGGPSIGDLTRG